MPIEARRALWGRIATDLRPKRPRRRRDRGHPRHARAGAGRDPRGGRRAGAGSSGSSTERRAPRRDRQLAPQLGQRPRQRLHRRRRPGRASAARRRRSRATPPSTSRASSAISRNSPSCRTANARSPTVPWPGTTAPGDQLDEPLDGRRPVQRIAVAEVRRGVGLEQVAGEHHAGVGHEHDDVVVGVAAAEVAQLDASARRARSRPSRLSANVRSGGSNSTS